MTQLLKGGPALNINFYKNNSVLNKNNLFFIFLFIFIITENSYADSAKTTETEGVNLGVITVTASKMERRLSEVASSVSIVSNREIEASDAKNITALLKDKAGIYTYDSSGVGTAGEVNMRGFWGNMSTHHLILIDGIPQNSAKDKLFGWELLPLDNIERIEILRGPASVLYGDNAMSGVINIITKTPCINPEGKLSSSYGNYNTQNYNVSVSGQTDKIRSYLCAGHKLSDGFREHCDYEAFHFNGKTSLLTDGTQDLEISFDYNQSEKGAYPWALTIHQIKDNRNQARPGSENDKNNAQKILSSIRYCKYINEISNIEANFFYKYQDEKGFFTSSSSENSTKEQMENEINIGSPLRLYIKPVIFGIKNIFITGIDLERDFFDYEEYKAPFQKRGTRSSDYYVTKDILAPYIQNEINLNDSLKMISGLRYDFVDLNFSDLKQEINSKKKSMSKLTRRIGMVYGYYEYSSIYANYSEAFRTPTMGQMFTYGSFSNSNLISEEAKNYEAGIRHWFSDYLQTDVSLYWLNVDNEIWYDYNERIYKNYGKTSHKGLETDVNIKLLKGVTGFLNYTYINAKNENGDFKGKHLTNIPEDKGSFGLKFHADSGLETSFTATRYGSSYLDSANLDKLPAYTTVDAKLGYSYKNCSISLSIDNILGKEYNSYGYKNSSGIRYFNPAPGRTFTFSTKISF